MTDFDLILHDMVTTRGAEAIVKQMLASDEYRATKSSEWCDPWDFAQVDDKQIRFEASRAAYKIAKRNKR